MSELDEMKAYVGYDEGDARRLAGFWHHVEPEAAAVIDTFYERVLANAPARAVLADEAQVERLKVTLRQWLKEMLLGPHDEVYYERRRRIGHVHVQVGLPSRFMYTAMSVVRNALVDIAYRIDRETAHELCASIDRISSIDLAIMTGTYIESREQIEMRTMQELIVSHLPVTVLLVDLDGRVTAATRARAIFGQRPVVGHPWEQALPEPLVAVAELSRHYDRARATGHEVLLPRVDAMIDGQKRSFRFSIVPLEHADAAALVHVEELTDAIEVEARTRRNEALAQLGAMSAAVAHELRNPLAGISGALQVIGSSLADDDRRRPVMDKVGQQVRRLNALVTDLLTFARPEAAKMRPLDLGEVVRAAVDATERGEVTVDVLGGGRALGDVHLLQHMVVNLVQNAVQAVGQGGHVRVVLGPASVLVCDDGPGVPDANRASIFEPFYTTRTQGTGLGLAICRKAATAMGASIDLATSPLGGAAFEIRLQPDPANPVV